MKVTSQVTTGFRTDGQHGPLVTKGECDFGGRSLSTQERAMIYALRDSGLLIIAEDDPPAVIVPIESARSRRPRPEDAIPVSTASESRRRPAKRRVAKD